MRNTGKRKLGEHYAVIYSFTVSHERDNQYLLWHEFAFNDDRVRDSYIYTPGTWRNDTRMLSWDHLGETEMSRAPNVLSWNPRYLSMRRKSYMTMSRINVIGSVNGLAPVWRQTIIWTIDETRASNYAIYPISTCLVVRICNNALIWNSHTFSISCSILGKSHPY